MAATFNAHCGLASARLRGVLAYIETHLTQPIKLAELAALARLSTDHFAAQFRASTGSPPDRFVVQRRIERSKALVTSSDLPLAEIGYAFGFASQAHFTTTFRKLVGVTPGTYRRQNSRGDDEFAAESCKSPLNSERLSSDLLRKLGTGVHHAPSQSQLAV